MLKILLIKNKLWFRYLSFIGWDFMGNRELRVNYLIIYNIYWLKYKIYYNNL